MSQFSNYRKTIVRTTLSGLLDCLGIKFRFARGPLGSTIGILQYQETLPGGVSYKILERGDNFQLDNTSVYTVPSGYVFGMGDNRDDSQDSRVLQEVGYIPMENLVGRAEFIFFSYDGTGDGWPFTVRWPRIFKAIR